MEISQSANNDPASRDQHVVSPFPTLPPLPPVAAANQSNENSADSQQQQDENNECPSQLLCCLTQEPPINGVTFDIPTTTGQISTQVFEHADLYRMIYTRGMLSAYRIVRHPIFDAHVPRELALSFVKPVSTDIQQQMDDERLRQSLSLEEESPLTAADHANMAETIDRMKDPRPRQFSLAIIRMINQEPGKRIFRHGQERFSFYLKTNRVHHLRQQGHFVARLFLVLLFVKLHWDITIMLLLDYERKLGQTMVQHLSVRK